ncbi:MAG: acyltransferase [Firmicutes bacterium]|nr:acyltransferase [Alicyclobacillaceae bacterium]MCL6498233.1 acyltransferase [Bacillota bacterium]
MAATAAGETPAVRAGSFRPRHLDQIDWIRALTTVGVIAVHSVFFTNPPNSVGAGAVISLLHYTREAFMFMTGVVLFYSYYPRLGPVGRFWRRRFLLIGLPYAIWSAIYVGLSVPLWPVGRFAVHWGLALVTGSAWYHLYYLLITMQIYLLMPWAVFFLQRTRRWHGWMLAASALAEAALMAYYQYALPAHGFWAHLLAYRNMAWFSYQFYILLGALTAIHLDQVNAWVRAHGRPLLAAWLASVGLAWAWYGFNHWALHQPVITASAVLQPFMVPYCFFWILVLYRWGLTWAEQGRHWRISPAIKSISRLSFGIYLLHPLVLWLALRYVVPPLHRLPGLVVTPLTIALTLLVSWAVIGLVARTPLALPLLGQRGAATSAPTVRPARTPWTPVLADEGSGRR